MKTTSRSVLVLSALALLGCSATTYAAPSRVGDTATKTVRFKDLDLSTADGAQELYERIATAARIVCREAPYKEIRECRSRAVDDAVRAVGRPLLSSVHRSTLDRIEEVVLR
ncbi:MAG TPA: UrcA family protein [Gammaproteobacteria bacterium]|nr:UrcA family protein [Gammaproteobacteria bacterium]